MLYSRVEIPSRITVARDIRRILEDAEQRLIGYLDVRHIDFCISLYLLTLRVPDGPWQHPHLRGWLDDPQHDSSARHHRALGQWTANAARHP